MKKQRIRQTLTEIILWFGPPPSHNPDPKDGQLVSFFISFN